MCGGGVFFDEIEGQDPEDPDEALLSEHLRSWEKSNPFVLKYKRKFIEKDGTIVLTEDEEWDALEAMLLLRQDLRESYQREQRDFPYLKK